MKSCKPNSIPAHHSVATLPLTCRSFARWSRQTLHAFRSPHRSHWGRGDSLSNFATSAVAEAPNAVVVVESPSKAKKIQTFLGGGYKVLATYGHVRDLAAKDKAVDPNADFEMTWQWDSSATSSTAAHVRDISLALEGCEALILATDPDREGEAISWHLLQILKEREEEKGGKNGRALLAGKAVLRITFTEVTKRAVQEALAAPRDVSGPLVDAYLARRALDHLVGFTLSPLLWRKLPSAKSAGRVQSVALRLVAERDAQIRAFVPREYWSITANLLTPRGSTFQARLEEVDGSKLGQQGVADEETAQKLVERLSACELQVADVRVRESNRAPPPPLMTSSMQQDASARLGLSPAHTMSLAQDLYVGFDSLAEGQGLITYMRTDGLQMSSEAVQSLRAAITRFYGEDHLPPEPRAYKTKAKNAQEAHEAIRPTDPSYFPEEVVDRLDTQLALLYGLIWRRAVASQMADARISQVGVNVTGEGAALRLRATASQVVDKGFMAAYSPKIFNSAKLVPPEEDEEEAEAKLDGPGLAAVLESLQEGEALQVVSLAPKQHSTKPPPRFTEASLVKALEEIGVGRPSTYASIISVLLARKYVVKEGRSLVATPGGLLLASFLTKYFPAYVDYDFTSDVEAQLDEVSGGRMAWKEMLRGFWEPFAERVGAMGSVEMRDVIDELDALVVEPLVQAAGGEAARACPSCTEGRLGLKLSYRGPFLGCSCYPGCKGSLNLHDLLGPALADPSQDEGEPLMLGFDPETGEEVHALPCTTPKKGMLLALGPDFNNPTKKVLVPQSKQSLPSLEEACLLLRLPRDLGTNLESGGLVQLAYGFYGFYVRDMVPTNKKPIFASVGKGLDPATLTLEQALQLLAAKRAKIAAGPGKGMRGRGTRAVAPQAEPTPPAAGEGEADGRADAHIYISPAPVLDVKTKAAAKRKTRPAALMEVETEVPKKPETSPVAVLDGESKNASPMCGPMSSETDSNGARVQEEAPKRRMRQPRKDISSNGVEGEAAVARVGPRARARKVPASDGAGGQGEGEAVADRVKPRARQKKDVASDVAGEGEAAAVRAGQRGRPRKDAASAGAGAEGVAAAVRVRRRPKKDASPVLDSISGRVSGVEGAKVSC